MFQRILVVVDHAEISRAVFEHAIALAQITGGELFLLHLTAKTNQPRVTVLECQKHKEVRDNGVFNTVIKAEMLSKPLLLNERSAKVTAVEPTLFNHLQVDRDPTDNSTLQSAEALDRTVAQIAHLCKADLIVMELDTIGAVLQSLSCSTLLINQT